jgi:hypothetical protein
VKLERVRPTVLRATFHAHELAALIAAVRYVADLAPADMPAESVTQLRQLLGDYDQQVHQLARDPHPSSS